MYKHIHIHVSKQTRQLPRVLSSLFLTFLPPLFLSHPPIPSTGLESKNKQNKKVPLLWKSVTFPWEESSKQIAFLLLSCLSKPTPHPVREERRLWLQPAPVTVWRSGRTMGRRTGLEQGWGGGDHWPRASGLTTVSSWEVTHLAPRFPLCYPGGQLQGLLCNLVHIRKALGPEPAIVT